VLWGGLEERQNSCSCGAIAVGFGVVVFFGVVLGGGCVFGGGIVIGKGGEGLGWYRGLFVVFDVFVGYCVWVCGQGNWGEHGKRGRWEGRGGGRRWGRG